ncbi:MAG: aspartate aminotransferase family protein [Planctomycetaceae bacterium]
MPVTPTDLDSARKRIQLAYDPHLLSQAGERLADLLGEHLQSVQNSEQSVLNWRHPRENIAHAARSLSGSPLHERVENIDDQKTAELQELILNQFQHLVKTMFSRAQNLHNPRYIGHQVPASVPLAGLFDALGAITNQVGAIYEMGPWAAATEFALIEALGQQFGLPPGEFAGVITSGGSLANLTALLTARNVTLDESWANGVSSVHPAPVLVAHAEAHYCIARSAGILGLGTNQVIPAELDERRRMDPQKLDELLTRLRTENRPVIAVASGACATPVGAFDPLHDIANVCEKHDVWLHVDAAHGGAACFSENYRHLLAGLERADSFICDAHKMMFVPALCAFVFYRNKEHRYKAFEQDAPYLFDPSAPDLADYDGGLKTIECTRRAASYGLWGLWSLFGPQLFADMVDVTFDLGRRFYERLSEAEDFEPLHEPECNIVVFRHVPKNLADVAPEMLGRFQLELRRRLIESGAFYIVPTRKDGIAALRVTIINPLTRIEELEQLLVTLREQGKSVSVDLFKS